MSTEKQCIGWPVRPTPVVYLDGVVKKPSVTPGETAVSVVGDFTWNTALPPSLKSASLHVPAGHLISIVGSTGSGKTTLLASLLGLTHRLGDSSSTSLAGRVAYVSQAAFLYNATVRDNILFGGADPPDEERYAEAIRVSSLTRDLTLLPAGDLTELGDRGVNVSGGQKQRISIARAFYANADIYLFDDPLSALDAKVRSGCLLLKFPGLMGITCGGYGSWLHALCYQIP